MKTTVGIRTNWVGCKCTKQPQRRFISVERFSNNPKEWRTHIEKYLKTNNLSREDLYRISPQSIKDTKIAQLFKGPLYNRLSVIYPDVEWHPWKFEHQNVPTSYWKEISNQRKFFDKLGEEHGVRKLDDWYSVLSSKLLTENGGTHLLEMHGSARIALMAVYPEHNWIPWKFNMLPRRYFHSLEHQRQFFDWLGKNIGVKELADWYEKLNKKLLMDNGGGKIFEIHGTLLNIMKAVYPQHNWIPWKFAVVSPNYWQSLDNQKQFFEWLGKELGVKELDDWYSVLSYNEVKKYAGTSFLAVHGSVFAALKACYPEHNWLPWKFKFITQDFWKSPQNQKMFLDWLGQKLGVKELDDWYQVMNSKVLIENGASRLLGVQRSVLTILKTAYPEHDWIAWKFKTAVRGSWSSRENVGRFMEELSEKLSIQTLDDWYRVDVTQLYQLGATRLIQARGGLYYVLKEQYPHHPWDSKRFRFTKKAQRWLAVTLRKMFPDEEILEDYQHPKATFQSSKRPMQLDVYIPSRSLAFEYQGKQHYEDVGVFGPTRIYQQRDEEKRTLCAANNIKLIEVPYWWNKTQEELQQIIDQSSA